MLSAQASIPIIGHPFSQLVNGCRELHNMNEPYIDQQNAPDEKMMHRGRSFGPRPMVLLAALFIALLLQGGLLLAMVEGGPRAAFASFLGGFDMARHAKAAPLGDKNHGDDHGEFTIYYGVVISRPAERVGDWTIGDTVYTVTESTVVEEFVTVNECVQVRVSEGAPTIALKIMEMDADKCGDDDSDDDGGGDDDGDDDRSGYRGEWEGMLEKVPPALIGEWSIALGANKHLTFTTTQDTHFIPKLPAEFTLGRWVEVKIIRQRDGTLVVERVRIDEHEMGEIVVRLESAAISGTIASKYNLVLTSTLLYQANIYLFATKAEDELRVAAQIAEEDGVIWAEVNYVNSVPEDDGYKTWGWGGASEPDIYMSQSAYRQIRMGNASRAYQGEGVVVALLDTGIYTPHEQFYGKLRLPTLDVIDDDNDPSEKGPGLAWGHGTHVAGVIAAMAPEAELLPVRVLDENGRGNTFLLAYAIEWAIQQPGVKVINLSLGTAFDSKILRDVIKSATDQGIIVVAAAGNGATNQVQYPAGYPDVVAVTAVDGNSAKASFANYGEEWVDISAPGVGIMSTMISEDGPGYATWSGTSMATAFVSGAAAQVAGKWEVEATDSSNMLSQLLDTGLVVDALNPQYAGQIGRLLDVSAALGVDAPLVYIPHMQK
jgi:subtilisin family serine protease